MQSPKLSIVIPLFNEADNLPVLDEQVRTALQAQEMTYEVLYVDDGSSDASLDVLRELAQHDGRLRLLRNFCNSGQSAALAAGFEAARGEILVTLDADLQNDPADIPTLLSELQRTEADLVAGVRQRRQDNWVRRLSSRLANGVRRRVLQDDATDTGCSLKAFRAELVRQLPRFNGMHRFLPALIKMAGGRVVQVPVHHRPRLHGEPKYNISNRLWRGLADLFGVFWLQRRWIDPRQVGEVRVWPATQSTPSGSSSASAAKPSSEPAFSSSGSSPSDARKV